MKWLGIIFILGIFILSIPSINSLEGTIGIDLIPTVATKTNITSNSSDYWDDLNTPADINTGDLTDDNTFVQITGDTMTGNLETQNLTIDKTITGTYCTGSYCQMQWVLDVFEPFSDIILTLYHGLGGSHYFYPSTADVSLGTPTLKWVNLFLSGDANIGDDAIITDDLDVGDDADIGGNMSVGGDTELEGFLGLGTGKVTNNRLLDAGISLTDETANIFAFRFEPTMTPPSASESTKVSYGIAVYPAIAGTPTYYGGVTGFFSQPKITMSSGFVFQATGNLVKLSHTGAGGISTAKGIEIQDPFQDGGAGTITTLNGLRINEQTKGTTNWQIYSTGGNWALDGDDDELIFGEGQDASTYWDGTNLVFDTNKTSPNTGNAWFSRNVSATGYITRTSIFDKSRGSALDFIKDADDYLTNGKINHSKFYGYTTYPIKDPDNCWEELDRREYCYINESEGVFCFDYQQEIIEKGVKEVIIEYNRTVCGTKTEEGIMLGGEVDVLRQSAYTLKQQIISLNQTLQELRTENQLLKDTICKYHPTDPICRGVTL
jgi:hypothetical protein